MGNKLRWKMCEFFSRGQESQIHPQNQEKKVIIQRPTQRHLDVKTCKSESLKIRVGLSSPSI